MVHGRAKEDEQQSQNGQWGHKVASGAEEMVTITKSQLHALLEAINRKASISSNNDKEEITSEIKEEKEGTQEDEHLPNWVRRNSTTCPGTPSSTVPSVFSQLENTLRRRSSSHPELGISERQVLSKLEQKRLQWQRERAEMQEWNPWGRPGAGAPRHQPVAAVPPRTETQVLRVHGTASSSVPYSRPSSPPSIPPPLLPHPPSPAFIRRVPPALRSSIPFGPTSNGPEDEREEMKRRWLQELEQQRSEQQHRRHMEQQQTSVSNSSWWGDNESSIGSGETTAASNREDYSENISYLRGQGFSSEKDASFEEKRQRALEYQRAIQAQMEEKKRKQREEQELRIKEEQEEERRLETERLRLQKQYELEQLRQKEKEENEERKRRILIAKMQEAQAAAEAARKARRAHRFQNSSMDNLDQSFSNPPSTRPGSPESQSSSSLLVGDSGFGSVSRSPVPQTVAVLPMQAPSVTTSGAPSLHYMPPSTANLKREFAVQTVRPSSSLSHSPYIENRILTPTKLRVAQRSRSLGSLGREFGTQTDITLPSSWSAIDSPVSTASSVHSSPTHQQSSRVQHSKPTRASHKVLEVDSDTSEKPKWGANNPQKVFVKMTDRDPNYHRRKKLQELRKQHWEREMATQKAMQEARRSRLSSHSNSGKLTQLSTQEQSARSSSPESTGSRSPPVPALRSRKDFKGSSDYINSTNGNIPSSPPVPALRKKLIHQSEDNPVCSDTELLRSQVNEHSPVSDPSSDTLLPSMRKKWHSQEIYVPKAPPSPPVPSVQKRLSLCGDSQEALSQRKCSLTDVSSLPPDPNSRPRTRSLGCTESSLLSSIQSSPVYQQKSHRNECNSNVNPSTLERMRGQHHPFPQDPLVHPEMVTGRPTPRQDKILQQLSTLRQGLLLKQREMESLLRKSNT